MKKNEGFTSLEFLISLIFISALLIVFCFFSQTISSTINKKINKGNDKEEIDLLITQVIEEIKMDGTPDVDSKIDTIWHLNENNSNGYKITIRSLSGLIDLNYINPEIILQTSISSLFENTELFQYLEKYKNEGNLFSSYEQLKDFISEENFNKYFTFYSFPNMNTADSKGLEILLNKITSSSKGTDFINRRNILKSNKQMIQNETEYNLFAGIIYDEITPYVNIKPTLNIHFIDESLLRGLLSYQKFEIKEINQKVNTFLSLREYSEIKQNDICNILGISKADELYYYLGCRTWFWEIYIDGYRNGKSSCKCIIARAFEENSSDDSIFYIVEKKWL